MKYGSRISPSLLRLAPAMLLALLGAGEARAANPPKLTIGACAPGPNRTYRILLNTSVPESAATFIETGGAANVNWTATNVSTCSGGPTWTCADSLTVKVPSGAMGPVPSSEVVSIFGDGTNPSTSKLNIKVTDSTNSAKSCAADFTFEVVSSGATGWGDPHLTTVDGVDYDFQSAGEFTALRQDGLEIQTRQSPVPTATVPITNAYTGITHCVSIYTAVAAKLGSTRVTLQPSPGAAPDPRSMQLRVNGELVKLSDKPILLRPQGDSAQIDGTLTKHADGVLELTDARGTQLVVTPQYWDSQKVWYLNVSVYGTSAHEGTMGSLPKRSWLPALPDGSSLGAKPASETERYQVLYEKFADAWRVTDATSLFDYKDYPPGTNTATYTRDEWPRNHPASCAIEGQPSVQGVTEQVAAEACADVVNPTHRANCVFDVKVTGHKGFAKSYEIAQRFKPLAPGWYSPVAEDGGRPSQGSGGTSGSGGSTGTPGSTTPSSTPAWCCWPLILLGILQLLLLIVLVVRSSAKKP